MSLRTCLAPLGLAAGAVAAAVILFAAPAASASTSSAIARATGPTDFSTADSRALASCSNALTGPVTSHNAGTGERVASIDSATFDCHDGSTRVVANALPWTMHIFAIDDFTIDGFAVSVTTRQGTCRYTGGVEGVFQFSVGIDDIRILMTRQAVGCGWPDHVFGYGFPEFVSVTS